MNNKNYINSNDRNKIYLSSKYQVHQGDYNEIKSYVKERNIESNYDKENIKTSSHKPYYNNNKIFNGNQKPNMANNNFDNYDLNNMDNGENCSIYESKYSKKTKKANDNKLSHNKVQDKNILIGKENYNTSNTSLNKNMIDSNRFDSNFSIANDVKYYNDKTINNKSSIFLNFQNINKSSKNINNFNNFYPSSTHLETFRDIYCSPVKTIKNDKTYGNNENNKIKLGNFTSSKSSDKIDINKIANNNSNNTKIIEITKEPKLNNNILKKKSNISLKKIPHSPRDKNIKVSFNKIEKHKLNFSNYKENKKEIKSNYSYSEIKHAEISTIQSGYSETNEKKGKFAIKAVNLINNKNFKRTISSEIDKNSNYKNFKRGNSVNIGKLNTIQISSNLLNEDKKNKILNISFNKENKEGQKTNTILTKLKNGVINSEKLDNKFIRRLNSQQHISFKNGINSENSNNDNNKLKVIKNNIVNSVAIGYKPRYTNDISININNEVDNFSKKNYSNNNLPIINKNKYVNNTEKNKYNTISKISITKINPSFLENNNNYHSSLNIKKNDVINKIKTPINKPGTNNKKMEKYNNNNEDDNWDDSEYMGLRKRTFDPSIKQGKIKYKNNLNNINKNTFIPLESSSQKTFIKSCESLSVPGRNDNGNKKINQDSYVIERNINGILNFNIFGVLDGHGEEGHYASQFVSRYITSHIKNNPKIKKCQNPKEIYKVITENGYQIIADLYVDADIQIQKEKFNCSNSGTTCVIVIQLEEKLICSNAGDSRAIVIFDKNNNDHNLIESRIYPLSYDCKPDLPNERKRIYECGGIVERAFGDDEEEGGPYRVWAKGEEYPGLAMSRSIGDMDAKKLGVIPNPQIIEYNIDSSSKYMIICSDGVWEFISNEDVMNIGNKFYLKNDAKGLCQELYKKSLELWLQDDVCVDDITSIIVFF